MFKMLLSPLNPTQKINQSIVIQRIVVWGVFFFFCSFSFCIFVKRNAIKGEWKCGNIRLAKGAVHSITGCVGKQQTSTRKSPLTHRTGHQTFYRRHENGTQAAKIGRLPLSSVCVIKAKLFIT